jgi:hypothetical protein
LSFLIFAGAFLLIIFFFAGAFLTAFLTGAFFFIEAFLVAGVLTFAPLPATFLLLLLFWLMPYFYFLER